MGRIIGSNKVHKALFVNNETEKHRKGRSKKFISLRNNCLCDRYLYYSRISGKRYDIILKELSTAFFLSESTISELLSDNYPALSSSKKIYYEVTETTFRKKMQSKWPHMSW